MATLNDILTQVNAYFSLDATAPTGDNYTLLTAYANRAVAEAAALAQLPEFRSQYYATLSTGSSFVLPSNFVDFCGTPVVYNGGQYVEYPVIEPKDRYSMGESDRYSYVLGNPSEGYALTLNNFVQGSLLYIDYQRNASGFATLTSVCELRDDLYVVRKIESYILQSRLDERAGAVEADANRMLKNMVGRTQMRTGGVNKTPNLINYVIGE